MLIRRRRRNASDDNNLNLFEYILSITENKSSFEEFSDKNYSNKNITINNNAVFSFSAAIDRFLANFPTSGN